MIFKTTKPRTGKRFLPALVVSSMAILGTKVGIGPAVASTYPDRPISIIVPYSAGGDADMAARTLSKELNDRVPQPIVVQNRGGAGGVIGSMSVHTADPDGYTLLLGRVGSQAILPALQKSLKYKWDEFTILGVLDINPMVCVVNAQSPYNTLQDLIDDMKARHHELSYSSTGPATSLNLAAQTLLASAGLPSDAAVEIPYKGGGEATGAVLAGDVDFSCNNMASLLSNIKGGRIRALVTTSPTRLADLPDVPTAQELGHPRLQDVNGWSALYGPANMSDELIAYWEDQLQYLAGSESWQSTLQSAGAIPNVMSSADSTEFVRQQYQFFTDLGDSLGLEIP